MHPDGMPGITVAVESMIACWDEIQPLAAAHLREVSELARHGLSLDRESYAKLEAAGAQLFVTARDAGKLVGYLSLFIRRAPHVAVLAAWQDAVYLAPDYRVGWNAQTLISGADAALRSRGVTIVYHLVPTAHDFGPVLRQLGYNPSEIVWTRHLVHQHGTQGGAS